MTTTTNVQQVKVNKVTQAQYDSMTKNDNEFYVIVDKEYLDSITSADVTTALGYTPVSLNTTQTISGNKTFSGTIYGTNYAVTIGDTRICTTSTARSLQTLQPIQPVSNGTVSLSHNYSLYVSQPSASTTFTFSTTNITQASSTVSYTFELCIKMPTTVYGITWPSSVHWLDGEIPDLSETGTYFLAFRTIDGGSTWLGNLQGKWN